MDLLDDEMINLWKAFSEHDLKYLMVGGFATNLHGFSRTTADLDIWIQDTPENRKNLLDALKKTGLTGLDALLTTQLIPGWTSVTLKSGFELDIMTSLKGFEAEDFADCYSLASEAKIQGTTVFFLHLNHLIKSKEASARPKDRIDLIELKKIRDSST